MFLNSVIELFLIIFNQSAWQEGISQIDSLKQNINPGEKG